MGKSIFAYVPVYFYDALTELKSSVGEITQNRIIAKSIMHTVLKNPPSTFNYKKHVHNFDKIRLNISLRVAEFGAMENYIESIEENIFGMRINRQDFICMSLWNNVPSIRQMYEGGVDGRHTITSNSEE